ncbi:MAG: hypothetical protein LC730_00140 [Acidobacteria bacterium]|nr:hypothetical protein [Acidobacteriota bacterium]MCA1607857.1 hypothetical protein [Acidobacteriota bacterium]
MTFGLDDERRKMLGSMGWEKPPANELSSKLFATSFVAEAKWPGLRREMAIEVQKRFSSLSIDQSEKIVEGEQHRAHRLNRWAHALHETYQTMCEWF